MSIKDSPFSIVSMDNLKFLHIKKAKNNLQINGLSLNKSLSFFHNNTAMFIWSGCIIQIKDKSLFKTTRVSTEGLVWEEWTNQQGTYLNQARHHSNLRHHL